MLNNEHIRRNGRVKDDGAAEGIGDGFMSRRTGLRERGGHLACAPMMSVNDVAGYLNVSRSTLEALPIEVLPFIDLAPGAARSLKRYDPDDVRAAPALMRGWMDAKQRGRGETYLAAMRTQLMQRDARTAREARRQVGGAAE